MKNFVLTSILTLASINAISQPISKFAAKCDSSSGKYLLLVSDSNLINLLEKPTQAGPFPWRGESVTTEGNYYKFSVLSESSLRMQCSLERKNGQLYCDPSSFSFVCQSIEYDSTLNKYKKIQGEVDRKKRESQLNKQKEIEQYNARPNKF